METSEVDWLVETMRERMTWGTTGEELLAAFFATFDDPAEGEASECRPCAKAVLDTAGAQ